MNRRKFNKILSCIPFISFIKNDSECNQLSKELYIEPINEKVISIQFDWDVAYTPYHLYDNTFDNPVPIPYQSFISFDDFLQYLRNNKNPHILTYPIESRLTLSLSKIELIYIGFNIHPYEMIDALMSRKKNNYNQDIIKLSHILINDDTINYSDFDPNEWRLVYK